MNNAQIEMFSVMVQTGNIHHTAQRFGIDAASITTSICALENEIGLISSCEEKYQEGNINGKGKAFTNSRQRSFVS
jgi:hypothetical protein